MEMVTYRPYHLLELSLQMAQQDVAALITPQYAAAMEEHPSFSVVEGGHVFGCGGFIPQWPGRAICWAMIDREMDPRRFGATHRIVKDAIDRCYIQRLEAHVACHFDAGRRWVELLGFVCEAEPLKSFLPCGSDAALYARVRA